ncbi:DNA-processing protein DprA [Tuberibacillus sp. Marseille-P3662]|uniref:DNA-processing protein DprA n=1 Tax=Tuberibacillus sp. Marseille-P3662 TaxID=1965358 RepID=UPI000A1CA156|nr:DNA-processing protein DprA [Tuberibacillus sp. Marseille-P3662]
MVDNRSKLIHVHHCQGIGWRGIDKLMTHQEALDRLYDLSVDDFVEIMRTPRQKVETFYHSLHTLPIERLLRTYQETGIHVLTIGDADYPNELKEIYDPPWVLYTQGDVSLLQAAKKLSVVGTRRPSQAGVKSMDKILNPLVNEGFVLVSGMAVGIDARAHQIGLTNGTIAVLGSGFDHPYPKQNQGLFRLLCDHHLVISEYPPSTKPARWRFPERNRIISGLSAGTLVVEAKERSGSLITADQALEQGRDVFAVPGTILTDDALGTNRLIQQGAKLVTSSQDIMNERHFFGIS